MDCEWELSEIFPSKEQLTNFAIIATLARM